MVTWRDDFFRLPGGKFTVRLVYDEQYSRSLNMALDRRPSKLLGVQWRFYRRGSDGYMGEFMKQHWRFPVEKLIFYTDDATATWLIKNGPPCEKDSRETTAPKPEAAVTPEPIEPSAPTPESVETTGWHGDPFRSPLIVPTRHQG